MELNEQSYCKQVSCIHVCIQDVYAYQSMHNEVGKWSISTPLQRTSGGNYNPGNAYLYPEMSFLFPSESFSYCMAYVFVHSSAATRNDGLVTQAERFGGQKLTTDVPVAIAPGSSRFQWSATSFAKGSSGLGAPIRAWMERRTVRICRAGLHFSTKQRVSQCCHRVSPSQSNSKVPLRISRQIRPSLSMLGW